MIPVISDTTVNTSSDESYFVNNTYKINVDYDNISGKVDGLNAVAQAVYLILSTERYEHPIYSWDYGIELLDLYGQPISYVCSELPNRISEALLMDDRIESVGDFAFEQNGHKLTVGFVVYSDQGDFVAEIEVDV